MIQSENFQIPKPVILFFKSFSEQFFERISFEIQAEALFRRQINGKKLKCLLKRRENGQTGRMRHMGHIRQTRHKRHIRVDYQRKD